MPRKIYFFSFIFFRKGMQHKYSVRCIVSGPEASLLFFNFCVHFKPVSLTSIIFSNVFVYMSVKRIIHGHLFVVLFFSKAPIVFWSWEGMGVIVLTHVNF